MQLSETDILKKVETSTENERRNLGLKSPLEILERRWQLLGINDLLQPPEPPNYLVNKMIRTPGLVCFYGVPGDLKTMIVLDLVVCIASGLNWLEPLPDFGEGGSYQVQQTPSLWLDQDNGKNRLKERFGALCRSRGIINAPIHAISLPRPSFNAAKESEAEILAEQIMRLNAGVCVIDNLCSISGGCDENSSQMEPVMNNLRWIAESTGAVLPIIHHANKGTTPTGGRDGNRLRGHSSIEANLDLALLVERNGDDLVIKSTKTRDDPVSPFMVKWTFKKNEYGALDKARFWHVANIQNEQASYITAGDELNDLLKEMKDSPSQNKLCKAIDDTYGLKKPQALQAIQYAVKKGNILEFSTGNSKTSPKKYRPKSLSL